MTEQNTRFLTATGLGAVLSFFMAFCVMAILESNASGFRAGIAFGATAAVSTSFCVWFFWRRAMQNRETRTRGLWLGVLTGFFSFVLMMFLSAIVLLLTDLWPGADTASEAAMEALTFFFLFGIVGFFFGGFLALPAGGLLGWLFSRNPESNEPSEPFG